MLLSYFRNKRGKTVVLSHQKMQLEPVREIKGVGEREREQDVYVYFIWLTALPGGKDEYFSSAPPLSEDISFTDMNLHVSRPLLNVSCTCTCL